MEGEGAAAHGECEEFAHTQEIFGEKSFQDRITCNSNDSLNKVGIMKFATYSKLGSGLRNRFNYSFRSLYNYPWDHLPLSRQYVHIFTKIRYVGVN